MTYGFYEVVGICAGILSFTAYVLYIRAILKGETKPNRVTWWIWGPVSIIVGLSYHLTGATTTVWVALSESIGPIIIAFLSLKYHEDGWNKRDLIAVIGTVVALIIWWYLGPAAALFAGLTTDLMGAIPTIGKAYERPEDEDTPAWSFTVAGDALNIFAINKWDFSIAIFPFYRTFINGLVLFFLILGKYRKNKLRNKEVI